MTRARFVGGADYGASGDLGPIHIGSASTVVNVDTRPDRRRPNELVVQRSDLASRGRADFFGSARDSPQLDLIDQAVPRRAKIRIIVADLHPARARRIERPPDRE